VASSEKLVRLGQPVYLLPITSLALSESTRQPPQRMQTTGRNIGQSDVHGRPSSRSKLKPRILKFPYYNHQLFMYGPVVVKVVYVHSDTDEVSSLLSFISTVETVRLSGHIRLSYIILAFLQLGGLLLGVTMNIRALVHSSRFTGASSLMTALDLASLAKNNITVEIHQATRTMGANHSTYSFALVLQVIADADIVWINSAAEEYPLVLDSVLQGLISSESKSRKALIASANSVTKVLASGTASRGSCQSEFQYVQYYLFGPSSVDASGDAATIVSYESAAAAIEQAAVDITASIKEAPSSQCLAEVAVASEKNALWKQTQAFKDLMSYLMTIEDEIAASGQMTSGEGPTGRAENLTALEAFSLNVREEYLLQEQIRTQTRQALVSCGNRKWKSLTLQPCIKLSKHFNVWINGYFPDVDMSLFDLDIITRQVLAYVTAQLPTKQTLANEGAKMAEQINYLETTALIDYNRDVHDTFIESNFSPKQPALGMAKVLCVTYTMSSRKEQVC
jgi:hypothetical protein